MPAPNDCVELPSPRLLAWNRGRRDLDVLLPAARPFDHRVARGSGEPLVHGLLKRRASSRRGRLPWNILKAHRTAPPPDLVADRGRTVLVCDSFTADRWDIRLHFRQNAPDPQVYRLGDSGLHAWCPAALRCRRSCSGTDPFDDGGGFRRLRVRRTIRRPASFVAPLHGPGI